MKDSYDVVVVGAGGAGMTAALAAARQGLDTVLVEKSDYFGGSTARSGGGVWIPGNYALVEAGEADDPAESKRYLDAIVGDLVPKVRRDTFIDRGPEVMDFVRDQTPVRFAWVPEYSDYLPESPGGRSRGRSVEPVPMDARFLGEELAHLHPAYTKAPANLIVTQADFRKISLGLRTIKGPLTMLKVMVNRFLSILRGRKMYAMGNALSIGLRQGLIDAGVPVEYGTELRDLAVEDGRVTGITVLRQGAVRTIHARHGVILGSGGFEKNLELRERYQPEPTSVDWTTGAESNTGGGHLAGMAAGADVALMDDAWWGPTIPLPRGPWFALAERNLPGSIIVNSAGQRFMNEALPYVEAVHEIYKGEATGVPHVPAWLVIDQRYRNRYLFAGLSSATAVPGSLVQARHREEGRLHRGPGSRDRCSRRGAERDHRAVQRLRADGRGRGLPPWRERLRQVLLGPDRQAEPVAAQHRPGPVLRREDRARRPRHQGRPGHGRAGPRAATRRLRDRRPLRRRQRLRGGHGPHLRRPRRHHRPCPGVRLPGCRGHRATARWSRDVADDRGERSGGAFICDVSASTRTRRADMPIDPDIAIGAQRPDRTFSWESSDVLLYHLGIGAGSRPGDNLDPAALRYTLDTDDLQVLPSFGIVAPSFHETDPPPLDLPGCDINLSQVVHGSQEIQVAAPLPPNGSATLRTRVTDVWDKGKAAVIWQEGQALSAEGETLWTVRSSIFVRGEGGWGGDRGSSAKVEVPDRSPDCDASYAVTPQQALLYRLCGDRNPLHADPAFAEGAGFPAPILHGLCSYGIVLRTVTDELFGGEAGKVKGFNARFAGVVFPGETIRVRGWHTDEGVVVSATIRGEGERDGAPVLADCVLTPA